MKDKNFSIQINNETIEKFVIQAFIDILYCL